MARNLRAQGFHVNVDDTLIDEIGEHFRRIAEQEGKPLGVPAEYDAFHYEHQIPGGMLTNFRSQLAAGRAVAPASGAARGVRARAPASSRWPIMITPFSQFVGTQAVLNVVHGERYRMVPDEVKKYALGYYGKLLAPVDPDVLDRIVENGSTTIALKPQPLAAGGGQAAQAISERQRRRAPAALHARGQQVDEMLAARAAGAPDHFASGSPVVDLVRELTRLKRPGRVHIRKRDLEHRARQLSPPEHRPDRPR